MKNIAIIYHDADFDGKLSNEVCRHWLGKLYPAATVHSYGWDYGRPVPKVTQTDHSDWYDYDQIYIVDLSVDELMARPELRDKIVWIDHHKSAIEKWEKAEPEEPIGSVPFFKRFTGYRIDGVAAYRLCWQWFPNGMGDYNPLPLRQDYINRTVDEPELLRLAGEYDIWDHRDPDAKALQFGLRALSEGDFGALVHYQFCCGPAEQVDALYLHPVIKQGHAIKSYCDKQNAEYSAAYSQTIQWEGLTFCALNIGQRGNSDLLQGGIKPEHEALFAWRWTGNAVLVSLYHAPGKEHHDLSKIAVRYGGGGHRGACGFRLTLGQLDTILTARPA